MSFYLQCKCSELSSYRQLQHPSDYCRGPQIPGAKLPGPLNFIRWRLIFVGPPNGNCLAPRILRWLLEFCKICVPLPHSFTFLPRNCCMSHTEENSRTHPPKYFGYESVFNTHEYYNKVLCKEIAGIYPWSRASLHTHIIYSCHTPLLILILQSERHVFSLQLLFTHRRYFSFVSFDLRSSFSARSISDGAERV